MFVFTNSIAINIGCIAKVLFLIEYTDIPLSLEDIEELGIVYRVKGSYNVYREKGSNVLL